MKYQLYDLRDLDKHSKQMIVTNEVDVLFEGERCSLCGGYFVGREEKDNAIVSGKNPLTYAHEFCWQLLKGD